MGINFLPKKVIYFTIRSLNFTLYPIEVSCWGITHTAHILVYAYTKREKYPQGTFFIHTTCRWKRISKLSHTISFYELFFVLFCFLENYVYCESKAEKKQRLISVLVTTFKFLTQKAKVHVSCLCPGMTDTPA